eukprot:116208-Pelagomonas_calceolata.AAC.5
MERVAVPAYLIISSNMRMWSCSCGLTASGACSSCALMNEARASHTCVNTYAYCADSACMHVHLAFRVSCFLCLDFQCLLAHSLFLHTTLSRVAKFACLWHNWRISSYKASVASTNEAGIADET